MQKSWYEIGNKQGIVQKALFFESADLKLIIRQVQANNMNGRFAAKEKVLYLCSKLFRIMKAKSKNNYTTEAQRHRVFFSLSGSVSL